MSTFTLSRRTAIAAPAATVHAFVDDFRSWRGWSPWEGLDPTMVRTYTGSVAGTGAHYAWKGNSKAGMGSMEITASAPDGISITLAFLKPWRATNSVEFTFAEDEGATEVTWTMSGEHTGLGKVFAVFINMDKFIGKDFEKGLAALKVLAEES
ncbi:MAG: transcriptional regulator [Marmoricola sp.]|nr:transcriptional regulator [Marmoricola sp.]